MTGNDSAATSREAAPKVSRAAERAAEIKAEAAKYGLTVVAKVSHNDATVTVEGRFTPGDAKAYIAAEDNANTVLSMIRQVRPGSVWGTDSASVGGYAGLTGGYVRMHKSSAGIRVARHLTQIRPPSEAGRAAAPGPSRSQTRKPAGARRSQQVPSRVRGRR